MGVLDSVAGVGGLLSEGKNGKNEIRGVLGVRAIVRALDSAPNEM